MGRHSEYFWQVGQPGPMVNGFIAEHFRAGLRDNPRGVLRQYTMPHAPGNTDANFLRTCFTHLAHGATALDFFGIGLNESFTENHIDHRAASAASGRCATSPTVSGSSRSCYLRPNLCRRTWRLW